MNDRGKELGIIKKSHKDGDKCNGEVKRAMILYVYKQAAIFNSHNFLSKILKRTEFLPRRLTIC